VGRSPRNHHGWVRAVCLLRVDDVDVVVSAGDDGAVHAWQVDTGEPVGVPIPARDTWISAMSVIEVAGRATVVTGDGDGRVRAYDLATGQPSDIARAGHAGWVRAVTTLLLEHAPTAVSTGDDRALFVWDLATSTRTAGPSSGHPSAVTELVGCDTDGVAALLSADRTGTVHGWNVAHGTGIMLHKSVTHTADDRLSIGVLGGAPAALIRDGWRSRCVDPFTGAAIGEFIALAGTRILTIGMVGGRDLVVATAEWSLFSGRLLHVWELRTGRLTQVLTGKLLPDPEALVLAETPDGSAYALAGYGDGMIRIWAVGEDALPCTEVTAQMLAHTQGVRRLKAIGNQLVSASGNEVCVWDLETLVSHGRRRWRRPTPQRRLQFTGTVVAAALSGSDGNLLVGIDSMVRVHRGAGITDVDLGCDVTALAWIGADTFAVGTTQGIVTIDLEC
jgi:WD40 repeat protein